MITEDYVSFETAKLLKEKGFDEACHAYYDGGHRHLLKFVQNGLYNNAGVVANSGICVGPTLQMAMKWLREEHRLHISAEMGFDADNHQYYFFVPSVCRFSDKSGEYENPFGEKEFDTYEEACEAAIRYCLENLI
jgi:hypothetical protein